MLQYHVKNRPDRELFSPEEINAILKKGKFAVISMCHDNVPYIVTLSYGYDPEENALYFHAAPSGLKLDFLRSNSNVCATVIEDGGYNLEDCSHNYKTVVFWGMMHIVEDIQEKKHGMSILLNHLEEKPTYIQEKSLKADGYYTKMTILKLEIGQIHGKAGK